MNFHPDPSKQAQQVSFRKLQKKSSYLLQQQPSRASLPSETFGNDFRHQIKFSRAY